MTRTPKSTGGSGISPSETTALPTAMVGVLRLKSTSPHNSLLRHGCATNFHFRHVSSLTRFEACNHGKTERQRLPNLVKLETYNVVNLTMKLGKQYYQVKVLHPSRNDHT